MSAVLRDARAALACVGAIVRRRPKLVLLFACVMAGSNLLRFWIGAAGGSDSAAIVRAAGWLFLVCRTFMTLWMHVATMRVAADRAIPWRDAFRVGAVKAGWFHLVALASILTFSIRLWQGQAAGGMFVPASMGPGTAAGLAAGLALTYLIFLPLQPGSHACCCGARRRRSLGRWRRSAGNICAASRW